MTTITIPDELYQQAASAAADQGQSVEAITQALWQAYLEDLEDDQAIIESRQNAEPTRSWEEYLASRGERVPTDSD